VAATAASSPWGTPRRREKTAAMTLPQAKAIPDARVELSSILHDIVHILKGKITEM
jgi:hypothetical protein